MPDLFSWVTHDLLTWASLVTFAQVIMIDIALAADNAVVIGMAASGLDHHERRKAVFFGIVAATVMRILLALITVQLLQIVGLVLAGGILLLWVCWKMWSELHPEGVRAAYANWRAGRSAEGLHPHHGAAAAEGAGAAAATAGAAPGKRKTLRAAIIQIVIADLSMSLDNVLAVAGAARDHTVALVFGLAVSIAMMGLAAMWIARLLEKHRWIAYIGLAVVFYVAVKMIWEGSEQILHAVAAA